MTFIAPAVAAPATAQAIALAPHRAIYEITLGTAKPGAGMSEMSGRMVYELTGSTCEGYSQNMRFVTKMTGQDGTPSFSDLRTSSWEEASGERFRFNSSQYRDDQLSEQTSGEAARKKGPPEIKVELAKPKKKVVTLSSGALFPIQHTMQLITAAKSGRTVFAADLYDASEKGEKVYTTNAYIGVRHSPGFNKTLPAVANAESLDKLEAWPVSLSYYDKSKADADAVPTYELAFVFFENGVSRRLFIDYGDFSIRGELKELTFLNPGKCDQAKK